MLPLKILALTVAAAAALALCVRAIEARFAFFPAAGEQETPRDAGVAFEPAAVRTRDGERLRGWYLPHPRPRALVVYFHGNGGNLSVWPPRLVRPPRPGSRIRALSCRANSL